MQIDWLPYARIPNLSVAGAIALVRMLIARMPKACSPDATKAAKKMRAKALRLQGMWVERGRKVSRKEVRAAGLAVDRAWGGLFRRIEGYAFLPSEEFPDVLRAEELQELLFADGMSFLTLAFKLEWAECEKRLALIEKDGLQPDIDRIAGPEFLANVKSAHSIYGVALGITVAGAPTNDSALDEPLRDVQKAISAYVIRLIAMTDEDEPELNAAIQQALAPIDEFRVAVASPSGTAEEDGSEDSTPESPDLPVPDVTD